ncbi:hypothetical protein IFR05_016081 [Cadophora sp. M221]|nr:hypothetical protein IFR05_016081 [Cadophora sp. M221]
MQSNSYQAGPTPRAPPAPMYSQIPPTHPQNHPQQYLHPIEILQGLNKLSSKVTAIEMQQANDVMNVGDMVEEIKKDNQSIRQDLAQQVEQRNSNDAVTQSAYGLLREEVLATRKQNLDVKDEVAKLKEFVRVMDEQRNNEDAETRNACGLLEEQLLAIKRQTENFMIEVASLKNLVRDQGELLQGMSNWSTQVPDATMTKLNLDKKVRVQPLRRNPSRYKVLEGPHKLINKQKPRSKGNKGRRR